MKKYDIVETIILDKSSIDDNFKDSLESKLMAKLDKKNKFLLINVMKRNLLISLAILLLIGGVYWGYILIQTNNSEKIQTDTEDENVNNIGIANPASTFCIENGGVAKIEDEENGQVGYCIFDNGGKCEEWKFFRGECDKDTGK